MSSQKAFKQIQAIRGMRDILPGETEQWQAIEEKIRGVLKGYGYKEIRMPLLEMTPLFKRSIGEVTDIVEKEMYTFLDRNGDSLTLRPEGTAGCVRACMEHGLLHNQTQRLWYQGPMFRHERPQKGRYRQFHQVGVEAFGMEGPDIDIEIILLTASIWRALDLDGLRLEINTLGTPDERQAYREALVAYFENHKDQLDEDSQRRLYSNPLRVLDTKNPDMKAIVAEAPTLDTYLQDESKQHFESICETLTDAGIEFSINPRLVRGLDYYSRTVFEWITDALGAQGTVCAGGRFDGLVSQLGGKPTPAVGFAMGLERLIEVLTVQDKHETISDADIYLVLMGERAMQSGLVLAEDIRSRLPGIRVVSNCGGGSFKSQFKRADKSGARLALVMGEDEVEKGLVSLKNLRGQEAQKSISMDEVGEYLTSHFSS